MAKREDRPTADEPTLARRRAGGPKRQPTAHDVARAAGVSQSAVSRSFTDGASVAAATREKIVAAAAALGYRPNNLARSLVTRQSRTIGLAIGYLENQFYPQLLQELSVAFGAVGYRLLLFNTGADGDADPMLEEVLQYRVDALLLASAALSSALADHCRAAGLPVILLNRTTTSAYAASITGDNVVGARAIAHYLLALGHRRLGFVAGLEASSTSRDRESAFGAVLAARGLAPMRAVGHYSFQGARQATRALLSAGEAPDAIFFANDHMAFAGIEVARFEYGLRIGEDISIVGFDDVGPAAWKTHDVTTYSQPIAAMVTLVRDTVLAMIADPEAPPVRAVVEGELIVRSSTRRRPAGIDR